MLDNFHGRSVLIAATNFEQALDPALWRRFDEVMRFERPTVKQIEELMEKRLNPVRNSRVSIKRCSAQLEGSTFGDIDRIATYILKSCALDGRTRLQAQDLQSAVENHAFRKQVMRNSALCRGAKGGRSLRTRHGQIRTHRTATTYCHPTRAVVKMVDLSYKLPPSIPEDAV